MKNYFYILLLFSLFDLNTQAQQIVVNTDSLRLFDKDTLLVYNSDDVPLKLDTLYSLNDAYGYSLIISTKDTTFFYYSVSEVINPTTLKLELRKNDTAKFIFEFVDLCIFCKQSTANTYFIDTLKLISNSIINDTLFLFVEGDGYLSFLDVQQLSSLPRNYELLQNYPNPFNPTTNISYSLAQSGKTKIVVYDILGNEIETLVNQFQTAGSYNVEFNASYLSSGVYFYRIITTSFSATKKMILIR